MITLRPASSRGHADHGWLDTWHSFSFADYHDPEHMGWGALRVINDDRVAAGQGFGMHGHRDMEIITYLLAGHLEHRDSLGNGAVIAPGEVQRMSAGRGVMHSEFNPSPSAPTHLLQIWIQPNVRGVPASYEQRLFAQADKHNRLCLIASPDGAANSLTLHQDARVFASVQDSGVALSHALPNARLAYLHVISGEITINGHTLGPGDAAKIRDEPALNVQANQTSEWLLFDLPPTT